MKQSVDKSFRKAASLLAKGEVAEAEHIYRIVLERFPANKRALEGIRQLSAPNSPKSYSKGLEDALNLYEQGRLTEALDQLRRLIDLYPAQADLHNIAGAAWAGTGQFEQAIKAYDRAIGLRPDHAEAYSNRATALIGLRRFNEALGSCEKAIELQPGNGQAHSNRGIALKRLGRLNEALLSYDKALRLIPGSAECHYNRANTLLELKRPAEAVVGYDKAIRLRPAYVIAHSNRGNALRALGRPEEALASYERAIALASDFAEAHSNLGSTLLDLDRLDAAHTSCRRAVELQPGVGEFRYNLAIVLKRMARFDDALAAYDAAIACDPKHAKSQRNRGHLLYALHRPAEAAESYARAVAMEPEDQGGLYSLGNILQDLGQLDEAIECYRRLVGLNPDHGGAIAQLALQRARICDWESERLDFDTLTMAGTVSPVIFVWLEDAPERQLLRATQHASEKYAGTSTLPSTASVRSSPIRIGYFSAEFHEHAVMFQLARMFELHDRTRFSVQAFSFGPKQASPMRTRLTEAFDTFCDVSTMSSPDIAALARSEGIDIAVDLMGYSGRSRTDIFAQRPAPIQVQYIGYPGTMGAPFIDYLVADPIVIPNDQRRHYAEKIICLPESYQANDNQRLIAGMTPSRTELGLPEDGFVFCCFNNNFKITPTEFDIWMRLLTQIDGSILWLFEANSKVEGNLRREAEKRGVDPARLIFAGRMPHAEHLARLRQADLFLDCFQCNAHATASDALWAGVPVLTVPGRGFAARVATSLVHAIGLPEMAVATPGEYERLALNLATDPDRLAALRQRLEYNRSAMPLFDSERFTRHIEAAFGSAYDRFRNGLAPDHIEVVPLPANSVGQVPAFPRSMNEGR